jgi:hypothetical protein
LSLLPRCLRCSAVAELLLRLADPQEGAGALLGRDGERQATGCG